MRDRTHPLLAFSMIALTAALTACGGGSPPGDLNFPDLVVAQNPGAPGLYWGYDGGTGELLVWVRNAGSLMAPSSYVQVTFRNAGGVLGTVETGPTGVMNPGDVVGPLRAAVVEPGMCFQPDCAFTVEVDSRDDVVESREDNNTRNDFILG